MATVAPSDAGREGGRTSLGKVWLLLRMTGEGFIADDAWSRGASIAYFTLFSVAPTLMVVIAVAGLAFGQEASQGAIVTQLIGLVWRGGHYWFDSADLVPGCQVYAMSVRNARGGGAVFRLLWRRTRDDR